MSNHSTRDQVPALRAPPAGSTGAGGLPSWALPAAVVLTAGDAASSLIDPALPLLAAGAVVATVAAGVAGNSLLLPRLRQLPARRLEVQAARQKLLGQVGPGCAVLWWVAAAGASAVPPAHARWPAPAPAHLSAPTLHPPPFLPRYLATWPPQHTELEARINELVDGSVADVLMLARCVADRAGGTPAGCPLVSTALGALVSSMPGTRWPWRDRDTHTHTRLPVPHHSVQAVAAAVQDGGGGRGQRGHLRRTPGARGRGAGRRGAAAAGARWWRRLAMRGLCISGSKLSPSPSAVQLTLGVTPPQPHPLMTSHPPPPPAVPTAAHRAGGQLRARDCHD